jgi:hypothetical protein
VNDFDLRKFLVENKLTPQSLLNEPEDDEYNIDASPEWNARELTVYNEISIDDFKPETISSFRTWAKWFKNQPPYIDVIDNGLSISRIDFKSKIFTVHVNGTNKFITYNFDELDPNKVTLVPESITEQDDYEEFTIDNPIEEWGAQELTVGSVVTPDMWSEEAKNNPNNLSTPWYARVFKEPVTITDIEYYGKIFITRDNSGEFNNTAQWYFNELNPSKAYIAPESITEQDEDDFDNPIEASPEWGAQELTVGSTITPDMWIVNLKLESLYPQIYESNFTITKINLNNKEFWANNNKGYFSKLTNKDEWFSTKWINPTKAYIKGSEQDPNLFESNEDEFTVEPSEEWNAQELNVGDVITPDMWHDWVREDFPYTRRKHFRIVKIGSGLYTYNDAYVETLSKDKSRVVGSKKWIPGHWLNPNKAILVPQN